MTTINSKSDIKALNINNTKLDVVAMTMNVQKAAVSKLQRKPISSISTDKLRAFLEAVGGELTAVIKLPNGEVISI